MLTAKIVNRINFPKIALQDDLEYIAKNIIIPDIISGIDNSMAINGGRLPANDKQTINRKGSSRPLIDTGELRSSFFSKLSGKSKVIIAIKSGRSVIGQYLQEGIQTKKGIKKYQFFGISKDAYQGAMKYMDNRLKELTSGSGSGSRK
jgi:hypothetical protein